MLERTDRALSDAFSMAGIGLMGSNMPLWLLDAGSRVTVWNRTPAKMAPALAKGAQAGRSAADVTDRSDVIQLCLRTPARWRRSCSARTGWWPGGAAGKILIDHSTSAPRRDPDHGRAPAAGGRYGLDRLPGVGWDDGRGGGSLVMMAGGEAADIERVRPVQAHLSRRFVRVGPQGTGQATKMVYQVAVSRIYVVLAEMVTLARKCGVEAERTPEALEGGFADSRVLQVMGPRMIASDSRSRQW